MPHGFDRLSKLPGEAAAVEVRVELFKQPGRGLAHDVGILYRQRDFVQLSQLVAATARATDGL